MIEKLEMIHQRFIEVSDLIIEPEIMSDMKRYVAINKEYKDLQKIEKAYQEYKTVLANIAESKDILANETDPEMKEMAKMELDEALPRKEEMDEEIKWLLIPKDPEDAKNAQFEIRAGTGGDEASIFAGDLFRLYTKYCEGRGWKVDIVDFQEGTSGGYKEIIFDVSGSDVYGVLKYESGVHRVQRVPQTETQGRVHTSAATVIVLPEAEEFDIDLKDSDIRVDSYCSSGPGGQSVNTTYSAIRLTHMPTGIVAQCQDQKSKLKNHAKALKTLRNRIYEMELKKKLEADQAHRKTLVASGDRSAKIRTYNYPQGRLTDHRIGLTLYSLGDVMNGDIQKVIDELTIAENTERLKAGNE